MADTRTADQWKQAANNLQSELAELDKKYASLKTTISQASGIYADAQELYQLATNKLNELVAKRASTSEIQKAKSNVEISAANVRRAKNSVDVLDNHKSQYEQRAAELKVSIEDANAEAEIAADTPLGPRGTNPLSENTPPVDSDDPFELERQRAEARFSTQPVTQQAVEDAIQDDILRQYEQNEAAAAALEEQSRLTESQSMLEFGLSSNTASAVNGARQSGKNYESQLKRNRDWRVRISLAKNSNYLYNAEDAGILAPLQATNGVIFPYTPTIQVTHQANYTPTDLPHSNYKIYNYVNSSVENFGITGDFTAQDTTEANYLLAVIHFFRSVTKMFYGQDQNPIRGIPPPLCYISGHGDYAFNEHPFVVSSFTLNYPNDVDYINASLDVRAGGPGRGLTPYRFPKVSGNAKNDRMRAAGLNPGGEAPPPRFFQNSLTNLNTRVPTRVQVQLQCYPIVSRKNISNNFSLKQYANGELLLGKTNGKGGMW